MNFHDDKGKSEYSADGIRDDDGVAVFYHR